MSIGMLGMRIKQFVSIPFLELDDMSQYKLNSLVLSTVGELSPNANTVLAISLKLTCSQSYTVVTVRMVNLLKNLAAPDMYFIEHLGI